MLTRGIQKWDLVLMVINSIIGAGIFGLPSKIFQLTGVYSIVCFIACAAVVLIFILCFAEVSSRFDKTGGPYVYVLTAFGKFPAFLMGWLLLLSRIFNYATLINLLPAYLSFFSPVFNQPVARLLVILLITMFLTCVNHIGIKNITRLGNLFTVSKLVPLAIFIVAGLFFLEPHLFAAKQVPSLPAFTNSVLLLVFAFGGFESTLVNSGEIQNPSKTLPFALLTATAVVAVFYILVQIVCIGTLPVLASSEKPLADAATRFMGTAGTILISAGAFISILGTLNILLLSGSRLPYAFSEEDQAPKIFSWLHPKYKTPTWSLLFTAVLTAVVSVAWTFLTALAISAIIRVLVYLFVCLSLIRLRRKMNDQAGFYKLRMGRQLALAGILLSFWLLSAAKMVELRNVVIFIMTGVLLYFFFTRKKQRGL